MEHLLTADIAGAIVLAGTLTLAWAEQRSNKERLSRSTSTVPNGPKGEGEAEQARKESWKRYLQEDAEKKEELRSAQIMKARRDLPSFLSERPRNSTKQDIEGQLQLYLRHCQKLSYLTPENIKELNADARKLADTFIAELTEREKAETERARSIAGLSEDADASLARRLLMACTAARNTTAEAARCYVYLKMWSTDSFSWYKVGITTDPTRRDGEQNVLPVPARTIALLTVDSADDARAIEKSIHKTLDKKLIRKANNRELFTLSPEEVAAVVAVMKQIGKCDSII